MNASTAAVGRQFGTAGYDIAFNIAADVLGNVYVGGGVYASVEALNAGNQDIFITKLNAAGSVQWTRQLGTTGNETGAGLQIDGLGNLYFMGSTSASLGGPHLGGSDIILGAYSSAGDLRWLQQLGTIGDEGGSGLTGDSLGNLYVASRTSGSWGTANAGGVDAVLVKLSPPAQANVAAPRSLQTVDQAFAAMAWYAGQQDISHSIFPGKKMRKPLA